jgi:hypothetical protein
MPIEDRSEAQTPLARGIDAVCRMRMVGTIGGSNAPWSAVIARHRPTTGRVSLGQGPIHYDRLRQASESPLRSCASLGLAAIVDPATRSIYEGVGSLTGAFVVIEED